MRSPSNTSLYTLLLALAPFVSGPALAGEAEWQAHMDAGRSAHQRGNYEAAAKRYADALAEAEAFGEADQRLALTINQLAFSLEDQGRYVDAETLYRRSLAILEKALGPDHPNVGMSLNNLAALYKAQGRYAEAEPLNRRSLTIQEKARGPEHPDVAYPLNNLASLYERQGRYAEAEPLYRRSLAIFEKAVGSDHPNVGTTLGNLAGLYRVQGRYAEAEPLYRRALVIKEKALGPEHPDVAYPLENLAELYVSQGRYAEAEPLFGRSLAIFEKALGPDHPNVGTVLNNLALLYHAQGRYAEAVQLFRRIWEIAEKDPRLLEKASSWSLLNNLALNLQSQGLYAEAAPAFQMALEIAEKALGPDHLDVGKTLNNLARMYTLQGRYAEAEALYQRTIEIYEKILGPDHPDVGGTLRYRADLYKRQKRWAEGLGLVRRATQLLATHYTVRNEGSRSAILAEQRTSAGSFELHVALLYEARGDEMKTAAEGFEVAQLARASDTAEQVANMAARYAAGSDALAQLARARQDAIARLQGIDARIVQPSSRAAKDRDAATEDRLRAEAVEARKELVELDARLEREYPQYRELTNPKPLELAAAQMLLAEDEALVLLLVSADESFLWVLRRGEAGFFKLALKRAELVEMVKKLRAQLDLGADDPARILAKPFDVAAAHDLYRKILGPAKSLLTGAKQLILVPDGAMQSLPLGVLVTELPAMPIASLADHAQVAWLAKKYAITVLPAAGSLRALRQFAKSPASREPFGGFGDPVLEGSGEGARRANV